MAPHETDARPWPRLYTHQAVANDLKNRDTALHPADHSRARWFTKCAARSRNREHRDFRLSATKTIGRCACLPSVWISPGWLQWT